MLQFFSYGQSLPSCSPGSCLNNTSRFYCIPAVFRLYCFYKNIPDFQEEEAPVFTLRLQEDGLLTLTFNMIPEAPVFRFERVKTEA